MDLDRQQCSFCVGRMGHSAQCNSNGCSLYLPQFSFGDCTYVSPQGGAETKKDLGQRGNQLKSSVLRPETDLIHPTR